MNEPKIRVIITTTFIESMMDLPKSTQKKITSFIEKFQENPRSPGINYENINNATNSDMKSVRIDQGIRGIVLKPNTGNAYALLWVDKHDDAYKWATTKVIRSIDLEGTFSYSSIQTQTISFNEEKINLLRSTSLEDLVELNIPLSLIDQIRSVITVEELKVYENSLSSLTFVKLESYLNGFSLNDVKKIVLENKAEDQPFVLLADDSDEALKEVISKPSEYWRLFLHPKQAEIAKNMYKGTFKLIGSAGTGKTVVAMHRVKALLEKGNANTSILFTTFSKTLCEDIKEKLEILLSKDAFKKVTITNIDSWVSQFIKSERLTRDIAHETESVWRQALKESYLSGEFEMDFLQDEWNLVICANEVKSREEYFSTARLQMGRKIDRVTKDKIYSIFEKYSEIMSSLSLLDLETAKLSLITYLRKKYPSGLYSHVIVDEAQDMSSSAFKLIRAIAGKEHPNDIFIVGDSHQRIYKNKASLKNCGIQIQGNTKTLYLNYRTSDAIYQFASNLLKDEEFDDLEGEILLEKESQSLMIGDEPIIKNYATFHDEIEGIVAIIKDLINLGVKDKDICVCARRNQQLEDYSIKLDSLGLKVYVIQNSQPDNRNIDGVRFMTMHRIKGLEFPHVIIVGLSNESLPLKMVYENLDNEADKRLFIVREKSLFYVAATRAKYTLHITSFGEQSRFI